DRLRAVRARTARRRRRPAALPVRGVARRPRTYRGALRGHPHGARARARVRITLEGQPALAGALVEPAPELLLAPLAASALRTEHAGGLDLVLEGFPLHHGRPRHLAIADDGQRVLAVGFCVVLGRAAVPGAGGL